jgi:hypothetical protein
LVLSLKDGVKELKDELTAQEEMLKNVIHLERFSKKYKKPLIALGIVLVVAFIAITTKNIMDAQKIEQANAALIALEKSPQDAAMLAQLKASNPKLYDLHQINKELKAGRFDQAGELAAKQDAVIQDLIAYQRTSASLDPKALKSYSGSLHELAALQSAYLLLKQGKIEDAKKELTLIPVTSPLKAYADALMHYKTQGEKQ